MDYSQFEARACDRLAVVQIRVDTSFPRTLDIQKLCLDIEVFKEKQVRLVYCGRSSGALLQFINRADVIDVRVSTDDLLQGEPVLVELRQDKARVAARV